MKLPLAHVSFACATFLALASTAHAFSREGHESIAELACNSPALKPAAKAAITAILHGETAGAAAEWPDAIKPPHGAISASPEAKEFIQAHPNHHLWHFVNFPVGTKAYDAKAANYAVPTDIVHAIRGCIAVLEGTGSFDNLSKQEALRYLLHLVGDAHQPLHTVAGYFDVRDPAHPKLFPASKPIPAGAFKDAGGNALYLDKDQELHALWDDDLVSAILPSRDSAKLVAALSPSLSTAAATTPGDYHDWIVAWVSDSMLVAKGAYSGLKFGAYTESVDPRGWKQRRIDVTVSATYNAKQTKVERAQILKGAAHLLQLLNAIRWQK